MKVPKSRSLRIPRRSIRSRIPRRSRRLHKKENNNVPIKIQLDGKDYKGKGNWVSSSSNNVYISYSGPKNTGRVYGPPKHYKNVHFDDEGREASLTWSGDWYDEDNQASKFSKKDFKIQFGKDKDYMDFKDLFHG